MLFSLSTFVDVLRTVLCLCASQRLITVPYAAHVTAFPGRSEVSNSPYSCGMQMMTTFLLNDGVVDDSCLNYLLPPDFAGVRSETQATSVMILNTTDMWG